MTATKGSSPGVGGLLVAAYAVAAYLFFLAVLVYTMGFLAGIVLEERDLRASLGDTYRSYARRVPVRWM